MITECRKIFDKNGGVHSPIRVQAGGFESVTRAEKLQCTHAETDSACQCLAALSTQLELYRWL